MKTEFENFNEIAPVKVYGSSISYFTGKLENYLRIKGVPYSLEAITHPTMAKQIEAKLGSSQMPALELADGRWMTDTTAIIEWFEKEYPKPSVVPLDPVQRFFSLLLEDYADEWLWRPAMHYRWYYERGARFASTHLVEELAQDVLAPKWFKRKLITYRHRNGFAAGDGIGENAVQGVEAIYLNTLDQLQNILSQRPFLLGDRPSLADVGFSGPMFRHFGLDPVPAEIMRQRAPDVYEWCARLWNSGPQNLRGNLVVGIPEDWEPILREIGAQYLPYLSANLEAVDNGKARFFAEIGGVRYSRARSSRYRVWCLSKLRDHYHSLKEPDRNTVQTILQHYGCWAPLWSDTNLRLDATLCAELPFFANAKMIDVY